MKFLLLLALITTVPVPPRLSQARSFGCKVDEIVEPARPRVSRWHVRVWADYQDGSPKWEKLHSIREDRWPALKDCHKWLETMRKLREPRRSTRG